MRLTPNQWKDYLNLMEERIKKVTKEDHIIHGYMIYRCTECGAVYFMNLEKGLEDPTDDKESGNHKPVPFSFGCICCGSMNVFHILWDLSKPTYGKEYRSYQKMINEPNKFIFRNFFWNDPESDCGIPIVFEPDFRYSAHSESLYDHQPDKHVDILPRNLKEDFIKEYLDQQKRPWNYELTKTVLEEALKIWKK